MNKNTITPDRRDMLLAVGMVFCGFLFWEGSVTAYESSMGRVVLTIVICGISGAYLHAHGFRQNRKSLTVLALMIVLGATFLLFSGRTEHAVTAPVLAAMYLYWVAVTCGVTMDDRLSVYVLGDALKQSCVIPFVNYETCPKVMVKNSRGRGGRNVLLIIIGLVIALPLAVVAMRLLSLADESFDALISNILNSISWRWLSYIGEIILGIPVAFYIFGHVYGNVKGDRMEKMDKKSISGFVHAFAKFPPLVGVTILLCLNIVYMLFLILQISHLISGLPEGMSYSDFARQGFFQLCDVVVLNLVLVLAIELLYRRKGRAGKLIRSQIGIMSIFTIGITCTALAKMLMYIDVYGLTHKRIYTSLFMIFLIAVFLSLGIFQIRRYNIGKVICMAGFTLLIIFNYAGVDRTIAEYNIARFENGTLPMMDEQLLYALDDGAVPVLYEFHKRTGNLSVSDALKYVPAADSWEYWSIERARADRARAAFTAEIGK